MVQSGFAKVAAGLPDEAPPVTLRCGSATNMFPSDGIRPSARGIPAEPATAKF